MTIQNPEEDMTAEKIKKEKKKHFHMLTSLSWKETNALYE